MLLLSVEDKTGIAAAVRRIRRRITRELPADAERDGMLRMAGCASMVMEVIDLFDRPQPKAWIATSMPQSAWKKVRKSGSPFT